MGRVSERFSESHRILQKCGDWNITGDAGAFRCVELEEHGERVRCAREGSPMAPWPVFSRFASSVTFERIVSRWHKAV